MGENVVDLRKERERRERKQRLSGQGEALRAVVSAAPSEADLSVAGQAGQDVGQDDEVPPPAKEQPEVTLLGWDALEYGEHAKQKDQWIRNTWLIAGPIALILLLTKSFLGAAAIAIGAFAFLVNAFRPPRRLHYAILKKGVRAGEKIYIYDQLDSFWIFSEEEDKVLSLKRKGMLHFAITIPIGKTDPDVTRKMLTQFLVEEEQEVSGVDQFLRRIGY